jgi:hypothetical protein
MKFNKKPSAEFVSAVNELKQLEKMESGDLVHRAFAAVACDERKKKWAESHGLTEAKTPNIKRLIGKCSGTPRVPGADHSSLWLKDGQPYAYVIQPYELSDSNIKELKGFCDENSLKLNIRAWESWYFPGASLLVVLTRKEEGLN